MRSVPRHIPLTCGTRLPCFPQDSRRSRLLLGGGQALAHFRAMRNKKIVCVPCVTKKQYGIVVRPTLSKFRTHRCSNYLSFRLIFRPQIRQNWCAGLHTRQSPKINPNRFHANHLFYFLKIYPTLIDFPNSLLGRHNW